jgi:hypothetical protein
MPSCACTTGYTETVEGGIACSSSIPSTCSFYVRIESGAANSVQSDSSSYLRIFVNDAS